MNEGNDGRVSKGGPVTRERRGVDVLASGARGLNPSDQVQLVADSTA
jgi:hypothetical protein